MTSAGALVALTSTSCSGPDPGEITYSERPKGTSGDLTSGTVPGGPPSGDGGNTSSGSLEGGRDGSSSGGITAFSGAPAYAAGAANGSSTNPMHNFAANVPPQNPAGQDCLTCHKAGGAAANRIWGVAGTLYTTSAGTAIVAQGEVRIADATGNELAKAYTDANGNFWTPPIAGGISAGSRAGVRNAAATKLMTTSLTAGDASCQKGGCHVPGTTHARINLQ